MEAKARAGPALPVVLVAAVALIDADGRVLLARRPEGKPMAGLWEFPGGKVDPGETPEAALVRELAEELAIDITESCLAPLTFASHAYADFHLLMPLYVARVWKGQVTARGPDPQVGVAQGHERAAHAAGRRAPGGDPPRVPVGPICLTSAPLGQIEVIA